MRTTNARRSAAVGNTMRQASRQLWLAGLGAAVVTRDWAGKEAGRMLGTLVREGASVEARALRMFGKSFEQSVSRANRAMGQARSTVRGAVDAYAAPALTRVRRTLATIELPRLAVPAMVKSAAHARASVPRTKAAKRATSVKRARVVKRAKTGKRAAKR
jgi:hypothetical protein